MKKIFLGLLILIILVIFGVVLYLGYLGFIPPLAKIMGADRPQNLGITFAQTDYQQAITKAQTQLAQLPANVPASQSMTFSGSTPIDQSFTDTELSARLGFAKWKYMPISNPQVKINSDGTVEFSGNIILDRLPGFVSQVGGVNITPDQAQTAISYLKKFSSAPPVYAKFTASVADNQAVVQIQNLSVGRFPVPLDKADINSQVTSLTNHILGKVPGFYAKSVTFSDGQMKFSGTLPATMSIAY